MQPTRLTCGPPIRSEMGPVQSVQVNIYQSTTYQKDLCSLGLFFVLQWTGF